MNSSIPSRTFTSRSPFSRDPFARVFFDADDGANNPGGDNNNPPAAPSAPNPPAATPPSGDQIQKAVDNYLKTKRANGDVNEALTLATTDAYTQRTRAEAAETQLRSLQADAATVAAANELLQSTGAKDFKELQARLEAGDSAVAERDSMKREKTMREACEAAGIDYSDLATRKGVDDWGVEIKEEQKDGKTVKVPYVNFQDGDKTESKPLAEKAFAEFPTLAKAGQQQSTRTAPPVMGVSDGQVSKTPVDSFLDRRRKEKTEKKNPLMA